MRFQKSGICGRTFPWRMAHSTSNISHPTLHIPHSQHPSPKSTRFSPSRPAPRPNTPFSAHLYNRLTFSHLSSQDPHATFSTRPSPPRNAIFRPSIPALSRLHPLPFASRYLSPRNPKHAQRPRHPSLTAFPPVPISPPPPQKPCLPSLCFTQNPAPTFSPNIFTLRPQAPPLR